MAALVGTPAVSQQRNKALDPTEAQTPPPELEGVGIDDLSGATVPGDLVLRSSTGAEVTTAQLFDGKRPVVLVLAYYACPMFCTIVLNGLNGTGPSGGGLKSLKWPAGEGYRFVAVSIDPRDTPATAREKRANYVAAYGRPADEDGYDFLVGDEATVKRLADAVGFRYRWDEEAKQYAHGAGAFVLTPTGRISRTLYGVAFVEQDLRLALVEAADGTIGSAFDKLLLFCFHYDPKARGYVLMAVRAMQVGGGLTALLLGGFVWWLFRREKHPAMKLKEA